MLQAAVPASRFPKPQDLALGSSSSDTPAPHPCQLRVTAKIVFNTRRGPGMVHIEPGVCAVPGINPSISGLWAGPGDPGRERGGLRGIQGTQQLEQQLFTNQVIMPGSTS